MITWIVDGRKNYTGPRDLEGLLELARAARRQPVETVELAGLDDKGRPIQREDQRAADLSD